MNFLWNSVCGVHDYMKQHAGLYPVIWRTNEDNKAVLIIFLIEWQNKCGHVFIFLTASPKQNE